ncbi:MAG: SUMF1/EgtB/PvdO family nonheme iron enzyme [Xenococcus sp. (in: cyanobacteria)]
MKILFLAANPSSTTQLKLGEEVRRIEEGLESSKLRDEFELVQRWAVRSTDIRRALLKENPDIVHFSGHGKGQAGLVIVDEAEQAKPATGEALVGLFSLFPQIRCVLLNACYAEAQAQAIVKEIDYVIGMSNTILDDAAIAFTTGFYDGLGYGRSIEDAFKLGQNAILWELASFEDGTRQAIPVDLIEEEGSESLPEHLKPILLKKAQKGNQEAEKKVNNSDNTEISSKNLEEYRKRIKEYVAEGKLNPLATFQLGTLAQELKIDQVEANKIWQEELGEIEEAERLEKVQKQKVEIENNQEVIKLPPGLLLQRFEFEVITVDETGQEIKRESGQAQYFTEDLGNGVTLDMVSIPGGSFMMGTEDQEIERLCQEYGEEWFRRERPQHQISIPRFFMGRYPITQAQWREVAGWEQVERKLDTDPSNFKEDYEDIERWLRPVENISWEEAKEFCERLRNKTKREYRLPTEAEWEYACRAETNTPFHFGETISTELANYRGTDFEYEGKVYPGNYGRGLKGIYRRQTTPVGYFKIANNFGLCDMHGNVLEWCEDNWHENYEAAPNDGSAWLSEDNSIKVIRSGSWYDDPFGCRSAYRDDDSRDDRIDFIGFRVVCVAPRTT